MEYYLISEVADSKHRTEDITHVKTNHENNADEDNHNEENNTDDNRKYLSQKGIPELWPISSFFRYSAKLSTNLGRSG